MGTARQAGMASRGSAVLFCVLLAVAGSLGELEDVSGAEDVLRNMPEVGVAAEDDLGEGKIEASSTSALFNKAWFRIPYFVLNHMSTSTKGLEEEKCRELCESKPVCKSFSWNQVTKECLTSLDSIHFDPAFDFFAKTNTKTGAPFTYYEFLGVKYQSPKTTEKLKGVSKEDCRSKCDAKPKSCMSFSYNKKAKLCYLSGSELHYDSNWVYYERDVSSNTAKERNAKIAFKKGKPGNAAAAKELEKAKDQKDKADAKLATKKEKLAQAKQEVKKAEQVDAKAKVKEAAAQAASGKKGSTKGAKEAANAAKDVAKADAKKAKKTAKAAGAAAKAAKQTAKVADAMAKAKKDATVAKKAANKAKKDVDASKAKKDAAAATKAAGKAIKAATKAAEDMKKADPKTKKALKTVAKAAEKAAEKAAAAAAAAKVKSALEQAQQHEKHKKGKAAKAKAKADELKVLADVARNGALKDPKSVILKEASSKAAAKFKLAERQSRAAAAKSKESTKKKKEEEVRVAAKKAKVKEVASKAAKEQATKKVASRKESVKKLRVKRRKATTRKK